VLGREAHAVLSTWQAPADERRAAQLALQKLLDVELAIMLHTYREDQQSQQTRAERLSTFGLLVGSVGHELRNPLGVIETSAYILRGNEALTENGKKHVDRIEGQVQLANAIVGKLLEMIQDKPVTPQLVHLEALAKDVVDSLRRPDNVAIELHALESVPPVQGDAVQVRQVLTNLVQNAIEALPQGGQVRVSAAASAQGVTLHVEDSGPGLPPEVLHRLFEPLVTTKPTGVGLGLALVKRIAERHGGRVELSSGALGGVRFGVFFPNLIPRG
jgi:signal transduction histidine kinase